MKSQIVLIFVILLGLMLLLGGVALWHISSNTEFSRVDSQSEPASAPR